MIPSNLLTLSFRPFFIGASIFSILSTSLWVIVYLNKLQLSLSIISNSQWHAHEMIYGYSVAVIIGFLLTAVKNWTNIQTIQGFSLLFVFMLWIIIRILFLFGDSYLLSALIFDIFFMSAVIVAISYPIVKSKQWKQLALLTKIIVIFTFNIVFYLGALGFINNGVYIGIYGGLYLIIAIILTISRRVMPFFIEKAADVPIVIYNSKIIDLLSILLFVLFFIFELFIVNTQVSSFVALGLFLIYSIRLIGWHTKEIWKKSLLWVLYIAFWFINLGFLLLATRYYFQIPTLLAIHAFAFGGIGIVTLGMMSRVSLGHTGRDVSNPPQIMGYGFFLLFLGTIFKVLVPIFFPKLYLIWIVLSQFLWVSAFIIFIKIYLPILIAPKV